MEKWLQQINDRVGEIHQRINDPALSDWNELLENRGMMDILNSICPEGVNARLLFNVSDIEAGGLHRSGCTGFNTGRWVNGTMDAAKDPKYVPVYQALGWRTIIYLLMDVQHRSDPNAIHPESDINANNPLILYSMTPNALTVREIYELFISTRWMFSAMLLRLGLSLSFNSAELLKSVIPGALLIISDKYIFDANNACREWFGISAREATGKRLLDILPEILQKWITDMIRSGATTENRTVSRVMALGKADGNGVMAEAVLGRTGAFEHIQINDRMLMGEERMTLREASAVHHFLVVQDISERWEAERLQQEMELARRMQINLLPAVMPVMEKYVVSARCLPANRVGGDVYDVHVLANGDLAVFLGDAVGHGIDSALLAATTMGAYRATLTAGSSPDQILTRLDQTLRASDQPGFITASCLTFSGTGGSMDYALAGQCKPLVIRDGRSVLADHLPSSLPLGIRLPTSYVSESVALLPGDLVAVISDGLLETLNDKGVTFEPHLLAFIADHWQCSVDVIVDELFETVARFRGKGTQEDDLTMVLVRVSGQN